MQEPYSAQPLSWVGLEDTTLTLTKQFPLNAENTVAMNITSSSGSAGIANTGYWGIPVQHGNSYHLSVYLRLVSSHDEVRRASACFFRPVPSLSDFSSTL